MKKRLVSIGLVLVMLIGMMPLGMFIVSAATVNTGPNATTIFRFIRSKGYSYAATCGILANIACESNFNPAAYNPNDNGSPSGGICQWHLGRLTNMISYCGGGDKWKSDLNGQLNFMMTELPGAFYFSGTKGTTYKAIYFANLTEFKTTNDPYKAGYDWARGWERCGSGWESRGNLAKQ